MSDLAGDDCGQASGPGVDRLSVFPWASKREVPAGTPPALAWLERAGYISRAGGRYALTCAGRLLAAAIADDTREDTGRGRDAAPGETLPARLRTRGVPCRSFCSPAGTCAVYVPASELPREMTRSLLHCEHCGWQGWQDEPWPGPGAHDGAWHSLATSASAPPYRVVHTPGVRTIAALCELLGIDIDRTAKILFYKATWPAPELLPAAARAAAASGVDVVAGLVMGRDRLDERKLQVITGAERLELADPGYVLSHCGAPVGSAGPVGLENAFVVADYDVMVSPELVVGANRTDYHFAGVVPGRDFVPHLVADLKLRAALDPCPRCQSPLQEERVLVVAEDGVPDPSKLVVACASTCHDANGLAWPAAWSPWRAMIVPLGPADSLPFKTADTLGQHLAAAGMRVLVDDRAASAGVKFTDADLLGIAWRVTVGQRSLSSGLVEIRRRADGATWLAPADPGSFVEFCQNIGMANAEANS